MKNLFFIIAFFALQLTTAQGLENTYTFANVQIKPSYPGGIQFFNQFVAENFQTPDHSEFKGGKMIVSFVIDTTGAVTDVTVLRDIGFGTADEVKRLLPTSEKWMPGKQDDKKVNVSYTMPITLPAQNS
jgi:protein TonB